MNDTDAETFEEMSLIALYKSLLSEIKIGDVELVLKEMPKILVMPYPVVEKICAVLIEILGQIIKSLRTGGLWEQVVKLEHALEMLKSFKTIVKRSFLQV